jgi:hypothetical protein
MGIVGAIMIGGSYSYVFFDDTVLVIAFVINDGFMAVLASGLFYSMLMPKMNSKGIFAGYIGGCIAQSLS